MESFRRASREQETHCKSSPVSDGTVIDRQQKREGRKNRRSLSFKTARGGELGAVGQTRRGKQEEVTIIGGCCKGEQRFYDGPYAISENTLMLDTTCAKKVEYESQKAVCHKRTR